MTAEVFLSNINNKQILQVHVQLKQSLDSKPVDISSFSELTYNLGMHLSGFLRIDTTHVNMMFNDMIKSSLNTNLRDGQLSCTTLDEGVRNAISLHPYLYFYARELFLVLQSMVSGDIYNMDVLFEHYPKLSNLDEKYEHKIEEDVNQADMFLADYYSPEYLNSRSHEQKTLLTRSVNSLRYILEGMINDLTDKQEFINKALSFIYESEENTRQTDDVTSAYSDLSRSKRLYEFDKETGFFGGSELSVKLAPIESHHILAEVYEINNVEDLIRFELMKVVVNGILIKKCANCGHYFASYGRVDTIYCDVVLPNQKLCSEIGPLKKFKAKTSKNPVFEEFNRAYKRNNAKFRAGKMNDFSTWSQEARIKRDLCINGELELSEFIDWLGNKR